MVLKLHIQSVQGLFFLFSFLPESTVPTLSLFYISCKLLHEHLNLIFTLTSYTKVYTQPRNLSKAMFNLTITRGLVILRESLICSERQDTILLS